MRTAEGENGSWRFPLPGRKRDKQGRAFLKAPSPAASTGTIPLLLRSEAEVPTSPSGGHPGCSPRRRWVTPCPGRWRRPPPTPASTRQRCRRSRAGRPGVTAAGSRAPSPAAHGAACVAQQGAIPPGFVGRAQNKQGCWGPPSPRARWVCDGQRGAASSVRCIRAAVKPQRSHRDARRPAGLLQEQALKNK